MRLDADERAARRIQCPRCTAQPGWRCQTASGQFTSRAHYHRWVAALDAGLVREEIDAAPHEP